MYPNVNLLIHLALRATAAPLAAQVGAVNQSRKHPIPFHDFLISQTQNSSRS
jgi:hypothetical protein